MLVRLSGQESSANDMPGGGPQGTVLGVFFFIVQINKAGFPLALTNIEPQIVPETLPPHVVPHSAPETLPLHSKQPSVMPLPLERRHRTRRLPIEQIKVKYVDDLSMASSVPLKSQLVKSINPVLPASFHNRTGHILPTQNNKLQDKLNDLKTYSENNSMKLNNKKTKIMIFNFSTSRDFMPELCLSQNDFLEVVEMTKLVGITITSNLKWNENTKRMVKKATSRLWMLRRLKAIGASTDELLEVYLLQVRSVLELAVPIWHPSLTVEQSDSIERVQKMALGIILGSEYTEYFIALTIVELDLLSNRRDSLCLTFARKSQQHDKHKNLFVPTPPSLTRANKSSNKYTELYCRTKRMYNSTVPYLIRLLNEDT